jgi:hypothetical protein
MFEGHYLQHQDHLAYVSKDNKLMQNANLLDEDWFDPYFIRSCFVVDEVSRSKTSSTFRIRKQLKQVMTYTEIILDYYT